MKCIIAGSRTITDISKVKQAIEKSGWNIEEVVSGGARGVDALGEVYAQDNGKAVKRFPADWSKYGRSAGAIRNKQMADYADALIAVWDGKSKGTKNMINTARAKRLSVFIWTE